MKIITVSLYLCLIPTAIYSVFYNVLQFYVLSYFSFASLDLTTRSRRGFRVGVSLNINSLSYHSDNIINIFENCVFIQAYHFQFVELYVRSLWMSPADIT